MQAALLGACQISGMQGQHSWEPRDALGLLRPQTQIALTWPELPRRRPEEGGLAGREGGAGLDPLAGGWCLLSHGLLGLGTHRARVNVHLVLSLLSRSSIPISEAPAPGEFESVRAVPPPTALVGWDRVKKP